MCQTHEPFHEFDKSGPVRYHILVRLEEREELVIPFSVKGSSLEAEILAVQQAALAAMIPSMRQLNPTGKRPAVHPVEIVR